MLRSITIKSVACLAASFCLLTATVDAQTSSNRVNGAVKNAINNALDPAAIESETIGNISQQFKQSQKQLPTATQPTSGNQNSFGNNSQSRFNNFSGSQSTSNNQFNNNQGIRVESSESFNKGFNQNQVQNQSQFSKTNSGFNRANNFATGRDPNSNFGKPINNQVTGNTFETKSTPTIQTQITAPRATNINQTARFLVQTQNIGTASVSSFKLIATLPEHAKFVGSNPQPSNVNGRQYEFTFNSLNPRAKQNVQIDVTPTQKLPLNIATQIQIESQQQVAVTVQQPVLQVNVKGPETIQTGKTLTHEVTVTNIGDGVAESVRINTQRPDELEIGSRNQKTLVPKLLPGQSAKFQLSSYAISAGDANVLFKVSATGAEQRQAKAPIRVIRPELGVQVLGPSQNYLGRDGIYTIQMQNSSEMPITDIAVELNIPKGLKIDTISQQAKIDKNTGILSWNFKNIPGNQQQVIQFKAKATAVGDQVCDVSVKTAETAGRKMSLTTQVLGRADLAIRVTDSGAPVGIGGKSDFTVEVANYGSVNADQVSVRVELPGALMPVNQPGYTVDPSGNYITFNNISVEAGKRQTLKFKVVAVTQGEHVVRGTVTQEGSAQSISSENSIFVFESENAKVSDALVPEIRR